MNNYVWVVEASAPYGGPGEMYVEAVFSTERAAVDYAAREPEWSLLVSRFVLDVPDSASGMVRQNVSHE